MRVVLALVIVSVLVLVLVMVMITVCRVGCLVTPRFVHDHLSCLRHEFLLSV